MWTRAYSLKAIRPAANARRTVISLRVKSMSRTRYHRRSVRRRLAPYMSDAIGHRSPVASIP
jgi:hypothetical protein